MHLHWHLGLGFTIIAVVALLPHGLVGIPRQLRARHALGARLQETDEEPV
jgi:branched-chain amino acid transport system permease protein